MSRQREWAAKAHEAVLKFKDSNDTAKLRTLCMKTPGIIHQSGLAQALVFLQSRETEIGQKFVTELAKVYGKDAAALQKQALEEKDLNRYMALTADISDVAAWFRRFAQIELKGDDGEGDDYE